MPSVSKKRKVVDDKRVSQVKWEDLYFVIEVSDKIQCLVCQQMLAVLKQSTCVGTTKQCRPRPTMRNIMLMQEKLEDQVMKHQHYANKEVSLPMLVSPANIQ